MSFVANYVGKLIHMPTPYLYVGDQSSVKMCETIAELGHKKVLLVTDSVLIELELHKDILAAFSARDIQLVIYKGVTPVFLRIQRVMATTVTFKLLKGELREQAYHLDKVGQDEIYIRKPRSENYERLDADFHKLILDGGAGY